MVRVLQTCLSMAAQGSIVCNSRLGTSTGLLLSAELACQPEHVGHSSWQSVPLVPSLRLLL